MSRTVLARPAIWILRCLLAEADKDAVIGDLAEERALRSRSDSVPNVSWWYWSQVSRSVPPLLWASVRRGHWLATIGAALAAYVLVNLIESAGGIAVSRLSSRVPLVQTFISLALTLSAMVLGGYVATRVRRGAAVALAVISAVSVIRLMATAADPVALGYLVVWLVACPVTALAGGALGRNRRLKHTR